MEEARDRIVFPLDVPAAAEARELTARLRDVVGVFKIGLELFIEGGPDAVRDVRAAGASRIFLDLKLHDIPATTRRAAARAAALGVDWLTVHCGDGPGALQAAVEGAEGRTAILGVTVLTSISAAELAASGMREGLAANPVQLVLRRAEMARAAGCAGVVCSGREAAPVRAAVGPEFRIVTPGIRPAGADAGDQQRVMTPARAIRDGSDYLVIGRPIREAADPAAAARSVAGEIAAALAAESAAGG
jgi:orotidine-5'-phosphate decarboxylase